MTEEIYDPYKYKRYSIYVGDTCAVCSIFLGASIYPSEKRLRRSVPYRNLCQGCQTEQKRRSGFRTSMMCLSAGELMVIQSVLHRTIMKIRSYQILSGECAHLYRRCPKGRCMIEESDPSGKVPASRYVFCETSVRMRGQEVRIELQSFTEKSIPVSSTYIARIN